MLFRHDSAMELRHLRHFIAVAETGNLTGAAQLRLHIFRSHALSLIRPV